MVLDEPTNAIDPLRELELLARYRRAAKALRSYGGILVIISHRFTTVRDADQIVVLENGQVAETGSHDALLRQDRIYGQLFKEQAKAFL